MLLAELYPLAYATNPWIRLNPGEFDMIDIIALKNLQQLVVKPATFNAASTVDQQHFVSVTQYFFTQVFNFSPSKMDTGRKMSVEV